MRCLAIFLFLWAAVGSTSWAQTLPPGAVVVANESGVDGVTTAELRKLMRGELKRWKNGSDLSVTVVLPSTKLPECVDISQFLVNSSRPASLQKYWLSLVFEGRAVAPVFARTQAEILSEVIAKPGAIGVVIGLDVPRQWILPVIEE